jgi:hypothetical protein
VFAALLHVDDARRATEVVEAVLAQGLRCALTGSLAIAAQLRAHGRPVERRHLNDIDLVVDGFGAIPEGLAASFLLHHVHPDAPDGKTLLQLIDETRGVRVDLFRTFGNALSRASRLDDDTGELDVLSVEDLVARATALVHGTLRQGRSVDVKHATAFTRMLGIGRHEQLAAAWSDHRQEMPETLDQASRETARLLHVHPELVVVEEYSSEIAPCELCRAHGPFRPGPPDKIIQTLGYW